MKPQDIAGGDERSNQAAPRKAYEKPRLEIYGDLAEISRTIAGSMLNDGSGHSNKHFTS
jgi:hypothetical protein